MDKYVFHLSSWFYWNFEFSTLGELFVLCGQINSRFKCYYFEDFILSISYSSIFDDITLATTNPKICFNWVAVLHQSPKVHLFSSSEESKEFLSGSNKAGDFLYSTIFLLIRCVSFLVLIIMVPRFSSLSSPTLNWQIAMVQERLQSWRYTFRQTERSLKVWVF